MTEEQTAGEHRGDQQDQRNAYAAGFGDGTDAEIAAERAPSTVDLEELQARTDRAHARYRASLIWLARVTTCVVIAALGVLIYIAVENYQNGERIRSCTTPGEPCYEEAQQRTADAVEQLVQSIHDDNARQTEKLLRELERLMEGR